MRATQALLDDLRNRLPEGRSRAIPLQQLATDMAISTRTVQTLVEELRRREVLVGSVCNADHHGYFICIDADDVRVGLAHTIARAKSSFEVVRIQQRAAERQFGHETARLFDLAEVASS